jgi:hypothetical protein
MFSSPTSISLHIAANHTHQITLEKELVVSRLRSKGRQGFGNQKFDMILSVLTVFKLTSAVPLEFQRNKVKKCKSRFKKGYRRWYNFLITREEFVGTLFSGRWLVPNTF